MRIAVDSARELLRRGRIFAGRGAVDIDRTGLGFPANAIMKVQPGILLEPYTTYWGTTASSLVTMGVFSYTHSRLTHEVSVGRYSSIAKGLTIRGDLHPHAWASTSPAFYNHRTVAKTFISDRGTPYVAQSFHHDRGKITIGNDVWIGENVTLGHGVTIGDGAVIASNAVVTKDVRSYSVVGGLPAKKIRDRFPAETIELLLESQWWNYAPDQIAPYDVSNPQEFARKTVDAASAGQIEPYEPAPLTYQDFKGVHG